MNFLFKLYRLMEMFHVKHLVGPEMTHKPPVLDVLLSSIIVFAPVYFAAHIVYRMVSCLIAAFL